VKITAPYGGEMARLVEFLEIPTGQALLSALPRLAAALAGNGPVLAPVAAGDHLQQKLLSAAFGIGSAVRPEEDNADDPTAIVIATSGSSGTPKGALLSSAALASSAAATQRRLGPAGIWLLSLPAQHIAGLQVLLRSLALGTEPHVMDTSTTFSAAGFVAATSRLPSGPRYVSLVPTQLHRILQDTEATVALESFAAVLVGGSATPPALLHQARRAGAKVVTSYGMSETCGGCVYDNQPLDGVQVDVDADARITLRGPMIGRGYRNLPDHRSFRGGGFHTDDYGELAGGMLTVLGRIDDVIISGGLKIAPASLEHAIAALPGVEQVMVVGIPDPEWGQQLLALVVPVNPRLAPSLTDVQTACQRAGLAQYPRLLKIVGLLPCLGPGKPDRRAAVALATQAVASDLSSSR